jgi:hypothetical protein
MTDAGRVYDAHVERWPREGLYAGMEGLAFMANGCAPVWTGVVVDRGIMDVVGALDPGVGSASDLDWLLRITARFPFIISKQPVAILTQHANSFSENAPFSSIWPGWLKMIENVKAVDTLSSHDREVVSGLLRTFGKKLTFRHAANALSKGNHAYATQAAQVQLEFFNDRYAALLLRYLSQACARSRLLQRAYSGLYNSAVVVALARRSGLTKRYGHLAQYLALDQDPSYHGDNSG